MLKSIAIVLSFFPGSVFVLALVSYAVCFVAELGLPGGSANIGLGLLFLAFVINIPTVVVWGLYFATRGSDRRSASRGFHPPGNRVEIDP